MTNRIMDLALGHGFKPYKEIARLPDPENVKAVANALTDIISKESAVIPQAEIHSGYRSDDWEKQKNLLKHINALSRVPDQYGLLAKTIQQALADEFKFPVKEVRVIKAGQGSKIFYQDEKLLSAYLRERFEGPETTRTFKVK